MAVAVKLIVAVRIAIADSPKVVRSQPLCPGLAFSLVIKNPSTFSNLHVKMEMCPPDQHPISLLLHFNQANEYSVHSSIVLP